MEDVWTMPWENYTLWNIILATVYRYIWRWEIDWEKVSWKVLKTEVALGDKNTN